MDGLLPLDDRILFACSRGARSAPELARKLKTDKPSVYSVLNRLVDLELLVVDEERTRLAMYETAGGVEVDYGPRGVDVTVDGGPDPREVDDGRCTATTTRGDRCKRDAKDGSQYCGLHASDEAEVPARG